MKKPWADPANPAYDADRVARSLPSPVVGSPTRAALALGHLDDDPELPIDIRAARAWNRGMVKRGVARHPYLQNLRMYVRFSVEEGNLTEAAYRLTALLAYADVED